MAATSDRRELTGPTPQVVADANIGRWLLRRADERADTTAVATPDGDDHDGAPSWSPVPWSRLADDAMAIAAGLIAAGLQRGDRVLVAGPTRLEWTLVDVAIMTVGAVTVPLYESPSPEQVEAILEQTSPRLAFVATDDQAALLAGADVEVRRLERGELTALAERADADARRELDTRLEHVLPDDVATVVFTSGTTGEPKGVPITHHQILWTARQSAAHLDAALRGDTSTLLFLPLAHVFARVVTFTALEAGVEVAYGRSIGDVPDDLRAVRPTFLLVVPRLLERVLDNARDQAPGWRRRLVDASLGAAAAWSKACEGGGRPGIGVRLRRRLADVLVLRRLRDGLGGRATHLVSGGARLDPEVAHVVNGAGITVLEGYGLTETTAQATVDTPRDPRIGTVGTPLPGLRIRLGDHDEIQISGPSVFAGYDAARSGDDPHDDPNAGVFADGWFRTGDQGSITDDGRLVIRGRLKEVIVTDTGEMVAPTPIEDALREHPSIEQVMVVGQDRPFLGALVVVVDDPRGGTGGRTDDVRRAIDELNRGRPRHERVHGFRILDRPFTEDDGELTPTMKLRRERIMEHFADDVEALYADARSS